METPFEARSELMFERKVASKLPLNPADDGAVVVVGGAVVVVTAAGLVVAVEPDVVVVVSGRVVVVVAIVVVVVSGGRLAFPSTVVDDVVDGAVMDGKEKGGDSLEASMLRTLVAVSGVETVVADATTTRSRIAPRT